MGIGSKDFCDGGLSQTSRTDRRVQELGIIKCPARDDSEESPPDVNHAFSNSAKQPTAFEEEFLKLYERQKLFADNGTLYEEDRRITVSMMEKIDETPSEQLHPAVAAAYNDIMERPKAFGFEVEQNNMLEQYVLRQGPHDFKPL
ncbi:MAG: hypothetical protein H6861_07915 [Rhodospirillales bacterium]|nr:hypothetical protein [Rhodospirillales bacterium]